MCKELSVPPPPSVSACMCEHVCMQPLTEPRLRLCIHDEEVGLAGQKKKRTSGSNVRRALR